MMKSYQAPFWLQYIKVTISRNKFCNSFVSIYHRESEASLYISHVVNCIWHAKDLGGPKYCKRANNYLQGLWNMIYHHDWTRNERWIASVKLIFVDKKYSIFRFMISKLYFDMAIVKFCDTFVERKCIRYRSKFDVIMDFYCT